MSAVKVTFERDGGDVTISFLQPRRNAAPHIVTVHIAKADAAKLHDAAMRHHYGSNHGRPVSVTVDGAIEGDFAE